MLGTVVIDKVRPYYDAPGFLQPFVDGIVDAVDIAAAQGISPADLAVVFTTHSVPLSMAERSGTAGERFALRVTASGRLHRGGRRRRGRGGAGLRWRLAYQSRSGPPAVPWLEPDINDVITDWRRGAAA